MAGVAVLGLLGVLATATPAGAQSADDDPTLAFQWHDPKMKEAFRACMEVVDWVAHGREGDQPHNVLVKPWQDAPAGISTRQWEQAVNSGWFWRPRFEHFTYRPHCDRLLPPDWETQISIRYYSQVYTRCQAVLNGDTSHERPLGVPAWYWEVSMELGSCWLLLPLGAFEVGEDENAWSLWRAEDQPEYPDSHPDPAVMEEYRLCQEYIGWRMENGQALLNTRPLGDIYDDPPRNASPKRVWHQAIHFYVDYNAEEHAGGDETVPAEWRPDCGLLLLSIDCRATASSNQGLLPEQCLGPHAISQYDIGFSQYDDPDEEGTPNIARHLWGGTTNFAFVLATGGIRVANWAVDWAYRFKVADYDPLATEIGDVYERSLMGNPNLRLRHLFWVLLVGWAAFVSLRGRAGVAGTEILVTIVLLMISGVLLEGRELYMRETWRLMDETDKALLVAGMDPDPSDGRQPTREELVDGLQRTIQSTFIEEAYDHLNWGTSLGDHSDAQNPLRRCATARASILSRGPWGSDPWPRRHMAAAGAECQQMAEFNRNPNGTRMLGAILVMISGLVVAALLILVGLTIVVAKLIAVLLFGLLPFVVVFVILPAYGRRLWWSWLTALMQVVMAVVGMSFLLSLLLLAMQKLTQLTADVELLERFALMDLLVMVIWAARRNLLRSGQLFAARLAEYLSATRSTGVTWNHAAAVARPGLNLLSIDRAAGFAVGRPADIATSSFLLRMHERRAARRSYRNLQRVSYWKRGINARNARWALRHGLLPDQPWTRPQRRQPLP